MTETKTPYHTLASGRYRPPEPAEIRELASRYSLTGAKAGALIGVDGRTWRRYVGGERDMPYSNWRLLLYELGELPNDTGKQ